MVHKNGLKRMLNIKYSQYEHLVIKSELQKANKLNIQEGNEMIQYEKVTGDFDLTGKNAIVVGGAGGIGEATARMYAKKGANVAINKVVLFFLSVKARF